MNGSSKKAVLHYRGNIAACFGDLDAIILPILVLVFLFVPSLL
jgi:hypothetical protein